MTSAHPKEKTEEEEAGPCTSVRLEVPEGRGNLDRYTFAVYRSYWSGVG